MLASSLCFPFLLSLLRHVSLSLPKIPFFQEEVTGSGTSTYPGGDCRTPALPSLLKIWEVAAHFFILYTPESVVPPWIA